MRKIPTHGNTLKAGLQPGKSFNGDAKNHDAMAQSFTECIMVKHVCPKISVFIEIIVWIRKLTWSVAFRMVPVVVNALVNVCTGGGRV